MQLARLLTGKRCAERVPLISTLRCVCCYPPTFFLHPNKYNAIKMMMLCVLHSLTLSLHTTNPTVFPTIALYIPPPRHDIAVYLAHLLAVKMLSLVYVIMQPHPYICIMRHHIRMRAKRQSFYRHHCSPFGCYACTHTRTRKVYGWECRILGLCLQLGQRRYGCWRVGFPVRL